MAAWLRSMDNYHENVGEDPPAAPTWRTIAELPIAAKLYA
jgi:hypothetical protein